MKTEPITLPYSRGSYHATAAQASQLFTPDEIEKGECRFEIETVGPWSLLLSVRGWATTSEDKPIPGASAPCLTSTPQAITFHGKRTLSRPKENGYGITGRFLFQGASRRVIDVSPLVQIDGGKLVSVACFHVCAD